MKNSFNKSILLFAALLFTACISNDDFELPETNKKELKIEGNVISIKSILEALKQEQAKNGTNAKVSFLETQSLIEGYVISNDQQGNFFKQLIIQDKPENPTAGIRIKVDVNPLYVFYETGQKVVIRLDELSLGMENGVPTLGVLEEHSVTEIPSFTRDKHIIRTLKVENLVPKTIQIDEFSNAHLNQFIKLENVQFIEEDVFDDRRNTFASAATDLYTGDRTIENCNSELSTVISTSTYASFKGFQLPDKTGTLSGILTKNFYGTAFNMVVNSPTFIDFDKEQRCNRSYLDCESEKSGETTIFLQDFTGIKYNDLEPLGWLNENVSGGILDYAIGKFGQDSYASITGFKSRESVYEVWLVTPEIDISETTEEVLNMDIQAVYDNGNILSVWITNSYSDAIETATWIRLNATIPKGPLESFGEMIPAGPIPLHCFEGKVRIGFKYKGGEPGVTTRYHIDNIKITGN
ncbi:DUF5689 domain-containing protein [Aquimarina sp. W85]|uniref:DUF5689 domain-containing protein n=1 Tax=Aquimarina rhodophyticola TaxID=3342246 RepID=UPI0036700711